jgi:hypothetical protein
VKSWLKVVPLPPTPTWACTVVPAAPVNAMNTSTVNLYWSAPTGVLWNTVNASTAASDVLAVSFRPPTSPTAERGASGIPTAT